MKQILQALAKYLPTRVIIGIDKTPYMFKYTIFENDSIRIDLHRIVRSDQSTSLHNHPWRFGLSVILYGGYQEERLVNGLIEIKSLYAGSINILLPETFHRVDLLDDECWTLIVKGRNIQDWGFLDCDTNEFFDWRRYFKLFGLTPEKPVVLTKEQLKEVDQ